MLYEIGEGTGEFYREHFQKVEDYCQRFMARGEGWAAFYLGEYYSEMAIHIFKKRIAEVIPSFRKAAHYYRLAAEKNVKGARKQLSDLYRNNNDPIICYHAALFPDLHLPPRERAKLAKDFMTLAIEQPELFNTLVSTYHDSWSTIQPLLDPEGKYIQAIDGAQGLNKWLFPRRLPPELQNMILEFVQPQLGHTLRDNISTIKETMENQIRTEIQRIRISILNRKWEQEGYKAFCQAKLGLFCKGARYVKSLPVSEIEKWNISTAIRNGWLLYNNGMQQIKDIEEQNRQLYPLPK
jgi:hypothetical protein